MSDQDRRDRGPVIVLDPTTRHSLATVRGLGRAGWSVMVAGREPRIAALAGVSRYAASYHQIPNPWGPAAPMATALRQLARRHGAVAIVACSDVTIARLRHLEMDVPTVPQLDSALDRLTDKYELSHICAEVGVRYPQSWLPGEDVGPREWPLVVKPRRTAVDSALRVVSRTGAVVARDRAALKSASAELKELGLDAIVQTRVERKFKVNVSHVRRAGSTSFHIAYRVVREYPPEGGLAATTETLDPTHGIGARALEAAERVCDSAGYSGLANVEFYGQENGELCLIEVNPRVWGSIWLPEQLGLEPASRAVEDALSVPPRPPAHYVSGRQFHRPTLEIKWLMSRSPERGRRGGFIASLRRSDVVDVLSASDPLPVVHATAQLVVQAARGLARAVRRVRRR